MRLRDKLFGDKAFYRMVLAISLPIMAQNGITMFVNLLDNVMVGRLGTDPMSACAIVNQLMFVFNVTIFGGVSGASIFGAQYHGQGNPAGVRDTFRFRLLCCGGLMALAILLFTFFDTPLISLYLHEGGSTGDVAATLGYARSYMAIILYSLPAFTLTQCYASTLRDTGRTLAPMKASLAAVFVNLSLNYVLIFGKLGFPALGVRGAAIATVTARYVESFIVVYWTHRNEEVCPFILGAYKSFRIPRALTKDIVRRGTPLLMNELLWSMSMAIMAQCYSMRGLAVMAGGNITSTVTNLFNIVFLALGGSVGIIVGNLLGAGRMEEARRTDTRLIAFTVLASVVMCSIMALFAPVLPRLYNTTAEVRALARDMILISACLMPFHAFLHAVYFTLRSGGKTLLTFFFDSGFAWLVCIPLAYVLSRFTDMPILPMYALVQASELLKVILGALLVRSDVWVVNLVEKGEP